MEGYIQSINKLLESFDDSKNLTFLELKLFFNNDCVLNENYSDQDNFYVKADIAWEQIRQRLRKNHMQIRKNNCILNINVDNEKLNIVFNIIDEKTKSRAKYFNNTKTIELFIPNYNFVSNDYQDYNELVKEMFEHEFKHFMRSLDDDIDYDKYSHVKNINDDYSYYNSPSEFEAFETSLFNFIRYKSNLIDIANQRDWFDLDAYNYKKNVFEWFKTDFMNFIKKDKKSKFPIMYTQFISHLNEKNMRKLYKDLYEYLFGLAIDEKRKKAFSQFPKYLEKEKDFNNKGESND